jgi:hypothetical protein
MVNLIWRSIKEIKTRCALGVPGIHLERLLTLTGFDSNVTAACRTRRWAGGPSRPRAAHHVAIKAARSNQASALVIDGAQRSRTDGAGRNLHRRSSIGSTGVLDIEVEFSQLANIEELARGRSSASSRTLQSLMQSLDEMYTKAMKDL